MWPVLFRIGDFPLRTFGPIVAIGFLVGVWWGTRLSRRYGSEPQRDPERVADIAWWILIGVIAGGRLGYVVVNPGEFIERPLAVFAFWEGGLVMYGGLILAVLLGVWKARRIGMDVWQTSDYGLTAGFLGQAIGRFGCLAVGDDYGRPTSVPWALHLPDPLPVDSLFPQALAGCRVHPTQIYMSLKALALFALGMWLLRRRRFKGQVFCVLLAGYAVLRFLVEMFRFDSAARGGIFRVGAAPEDVERNLIALGLKLPGGEWLDFERFRALLCAGEPGLHPELLLSTSQMVSLVVLPAALILFWILSRRPSGRLAPASGGAAGAP